MKRIIATIALALSILTTNLHCSLVDFMADQISAYLTPIAHQVLLSNAVFAQVHFIGLGIAAQMIKMHSTNINKAEHATGALLATMGGAFTAITPAYIAVHTLPIQSTPCSALSSTLLKRGAFTGLMAYETGRFAAYSLARAGQLTKQPLIKVLSQTHIPTLKLPSNTNTLRTMLKKYLPFVPTYSHNT